jgi:hypothetical protein
VCGFDQNGFFVEDLEPQWCYKLHSYHLTPAEHSFMLLPHLTTSQARNLN